LFPYRGRGTVQPDLAVPVQGHERPGGVHLLVHHGQIQVVPLGDLRPVLHRGPAQRVGADAHARGADGIQVQHAGQIVHIGEQVVVPVHVLSVYRALEGDPWDRPHALTQQLVGPCGDPRGRLGAGRPAVWRVVLEATVPRRVVRGGDHNPIRHA